MEEQCFDEKNVYATGACIIYIYMFGALLFNGCIKNDCIFHTMPDAFNACFDETIAKMSFA